MSLRKDDLERAVGGLLCPRHYEFLLHVRSQLQKNSASATARRYKAAEDVIKMVHTARPSMPALGVSDALHVLNEALRRIE